MAQQKKISIKTVVGDIKALMASGEIARDKDTPIMRVLGNVRAYQAGESNYGAYNKLLGSFEATNLLTGDVVGAAQCFVPDLIADLIISQVDAAEKGESVLFGADIIVSPDETTAIGYQYKAAPLANKGADPLAELRDMVPPLALENKSAKAPAKAAAKKEPAKAG